jgi:glutamate carboxypeptidase
MKKNLRIQGNRPFYQGHSLAVLFVRSLVVLLAAVACHATASEGLDPVETSIVEWSQEHLDDAVGLLEKTVNINSGSLNREGVRNVGVVMRRALDGLGFETRWVSQPDTMRRGGHLFARRDGDRGKKVLMIGHLDTVFEPDDAFQSFKRDGDWATGPGVADMKGGNVVIIHALRALKNAGVLDGLQITVAFTGDEEAPGKPLSESRKDLIEAGAWADVALGFEAGMNREGHESVTVARRGSLGWCLVVTGVQAHSSVIFSEQVGAGAIFEAARILDGFYEEVKGEQYLSFNAGTIMGGTVVDSDCESAEGSAFGKTNVVPNRVVVRGGLRTISSDQLKRAKEGMRSVVERHLPRTKATITFNEGYPAMTPTGGNRRLHAMLSDINVDLGRDPMPEFDPSKRGAADISFVASQTDGLAGMGVYGNGAHTPRESVDLNSLTLAAQRTAILIYRLSLED